MVLDKKEGFGGPSPTDHLHRDELKSEVACLAQLEESSWWQKSRVLWLKEGANNTKFFHKVANSNCRRNYIGGLEVEGVFYEEENEMRDLVVQFYKSLYSESEEWRPLMGCLFLLLGRLRDLSWRDGLKRRRLFKS